MFEFTSNALWCYPNVKLEIRNLSLITFTAECDIPVPGILVLFGWYRYRKKVPVPISEKIGPGTVEFPGTPGHCIF